MKQRFRLREVEFLGEKEYTQGYGLTYDDLDVVVEMDDGEEIVEIQRGWKRGVGTDAEIPRITVWIRTPL